jgi:predicted Rossmann fold flavoprotein
MTQRTSSKKNRTIIIGGGAAGFFAAINLGTMSPGHEIIILEKSGKLLSKVRISGGGRCNVTHSCFDNSELIKNYPRGNKELRQVFARFGVSDTIKWFENHGVKLKTENDGRMFPVTDNSETIISCFLELCKELNIRIVTNCEVFAIRRNETGFFIKTNKETFEADFIICASGGHPKAGAYDYLKNIGHNIDQPIPSLFTFNLPGEPLVRELQGIAVESAHVTARAEKMSYNGPVLITHWGLSGPAVLKLSAFAAQPFHESGYQSEIIVNWAFPYTENTAREVLQSLRNKNPKASPYSNPAFSLPRRLWEHLCAAAGIPLKTTWAETGKKHFESLLQLITGSRYQMKGKTTFKEEFVTCGGVNLKEVNFKTMESKIAPGVYFCGEVLNLDAITGGFNFQAAWSTAYICASSINSLLSHKQ